MISADDPSIRPLSREAARAADAAHPDPLGDPRPRRRVPGAVREHRARVRARPRARHPGPGRRPRARVPGHQERRARAVRARRRPVPARRRARPHPRRRRSPRSPACARSGRGCAQVDGQARRRRLRRGQRDRRAAPAAAPRRAHRARRGSASASTRCACRPPASRSATTSSGSSAAADRRGADRRARAAQPERPARAGATASARIVSTHDQILDGDGCIGCRFPADARVRRRDHRRGAPRSARCWPRRARSAARRSTSSSPATLPATGARTRSSSTCARAARRIRWRRWSCSAAARTTPSRRRSAPPCGSPRHYVATDHLESPRLTALGHGGLLTLAGCRGWRWTAAAWSSTCSARSDELGRVGHDRDRPHGGGRPAALRARAGIAARRPRRSSTRRSRSPSRRAPSTPAAGAWRR